MTGAPHWGQLSSTRQARGSDFFTALVAIGGSRQILGSTVWAFQGAGLFFYGPPTPGTELGVRRQVLAALNTSGEDDKLVSAKRAEPRSSRHLLLTLGAR